MRPTSELGGCISRTTCVVPDAFKEGMELEVAQKWAG